MSNDNIKFRVVKPEDFQEVIDFIIEYFYRDEPLCSCEPKLVAGIDDQKDILEALQYNCSILAVQETAEGEELVAVNIAMPKDPSSVDKYFKVAEDIGVETKWGKMLYMLGVANREADVFNRYGVDKLLYSFMTCVKPTIRGKNLGTRIKLELMALAKSLGYKLVTADCTSFYSAGLLERLGWDRTNFIAYKDYVDENKKQIFAPSSPHVGMNSFATRL